MIINGFKVKNIVIKDENGKDIIFIGEDEVKNSSNLRIFYTPKFDESFSQELVEGKNSEVNV